MYVAVDIGGTKTTIAAFSDLTPQFQTRDLTFPTPSDYFETINLITRTLDSFLSSKTTLQGISVSLATRVNESGQVISPSNLPQFYHQHPASDINATYHTRILLHNDAVCAGYSQFALNREPPSSLLHLVLGTGFGAAFLFRYQQTLVKLPLEPGLTIIHPGGMPHTKHQLKGSIEAYLGGSQIAAQLTKPLSAIPDDHRIWTQAAHYLSLVIYNYQQLFSPQLISFSGGLITHRSFLLNLVAKNLQLYSHLATPPPLKLITDFANPSLIGALLLLQEPTSH